MTRRRTPERSRSISAPNIPSFMSAPREAQDVIPELPTIYDEPFADSSQVPTYLLSKLTRQHVTVALSGDGGDELFAGYTRHRFARALANMPESLGRGLACGLGLAGPALWDRLFDLFPARKRPWLGGDKMLKAAAMFQQGGEAGAYRSLVSAWDEPDAIVRQGRELKGPIFDGSLAKALPDGLDRMQYLDTLTYLPDDILTKVDRASMAVALEVRVPILDHRLVELSWRLPSRFKMRRGQGKWLLRQVLYRHVPKATGRTAQDGLRHTHWQLAQGAAQALGRGAVVGKAARRGRVAQSRAHPRALARASRRTA